MACDLVIGGRRNSGIVLDISYRGVFIQTNAKPKLGTEVEIVMKLPGEKEPDYLQAKVARLKMVPSQLTALAQGGIGFRVLNPPASYRKFVGENAREQAPAPSKTSGSRRSSRSRPKSSSEKTRFRVRASPRDGGEPKSYLLTAPSADEAREVAAKKLGESWEIVGVEPA